MTMSEVEVDRITQQVFAARNSGLDAALVKVVIDEIDKATTTEAMLATLVERGALTEERMPWTRGHHKHMRRHVTSWDGPFVTEVAP